MTKGGDTSMGEGGRSFPPTSWSIVAGVQASNPEKRKRALDGLCERYWKPVYHFVRRAWSKSPDDAMDRTQAFFQKLIEGDALQRYEVARGGFRIYLKVLLRGFSADEHDKEHAWKRGGRIKWLPIDREDFPKDILPDPKTSRPEDVLDLGWRQEILERALERLHESFAGEGREHQFRVLQEYVLADHDEKQTYAGVAEKLGMAESDVRNHLHTTRKRLKEEIRLEISQTVKDPEELDMELQELFGF